MKIIIASPPFSTNTGGILVLHKLCSILTDLGYDVYITNMTSNNLGYSINPKYNTKILSLNEIDTENDIIVYPDISVGNEYNVKKCVRYILYHPYEERHITWGNNDFWLYYRDFFYDGIREKNILEIVESNVNYFKNINVNRDINSCFLVKKGAYYLELLTTSHPSDAIELMSHGSMEYYFDMFNKCKRFYCYDNETYLSEIAAFCGCESIIVPKNNVSKDEFLLKNPNRKYGIAYGLSDIENCKNVDLLINNYIQLEKSQVLNTKLMFDKIIEYFKLIG